MFITRITKLVSCGLVSSIVALSLGQDERAQKYLLRSLAGDYRTNVVAVMKQRQSFDKGFVIVKVQKSIDGKTRETVLSPLHLQCEYLDDGKTVQTYSPDDRTLIIQPSGPGNIDISYRTPLILKNYQLKSETGKKIAGRSCIMVTASAKSSQVSDIRYYFDEKTGFALSKETIRPDGEVVVEYEVVDIKFPAKLDKSIFKIEPPVGYETVSYGEPTKFATLREAELQLGFAPIIPSKIPYGFQVQKMTMTSNSRWKALCLKLTDGLQRVTVYQWIPEKGETIKTGENRIIRLHNGLSIMIVSDIDAAVRSNLIRSFLVRAERESPIIQTSIGF